MRRGIVIAVGACLGIEVSAPGSSEACSVCGCGDPLVDASDSMAMAVKLRFAIDFEYLTADAASDDDPAATESVTQMTVRPVVVYSPRPDLNLVLQIPIVRKEWSLTGPSDAAAADNAGLGDVDLGVRWFFFSQTSFSSMYRHSAGLTVGTSAPTGPNDAMDAGMRIDDHAQLGTGSWGPYAGMVYAFHLDPWNVYASATARFHSTSSYDYRYGTAFLWTTRLDYRIVDRFAVELGVDGRVALRDTAGGDDQVNTGGLVLAATPGVIVNVAGDAWIRARAQLPFVTSLNGTQSVGPTFSVSLQYVVR